MITDGSNLVWTLLKLRYRLCASRRSLINYDG
jgi:hypothetical protein